MALIRQTGRWLALIALTGSAACGGSGGGPQQAGLPVSGAYAYGTAARGKSGGKIAHVVIIIQENRSFDNLFQGYPGADTQSYGYTSSGQKIQLAPIGLNSGWDVDHGSKAFFAACDGQGSLPGTNCKMDGFDREFVSCSIPPGPPCPNKTPQYAYVPQAETKPYFAMAKQYVLADRMFPSNFDGSFVSHQYLIAGQSSSAVDYPLTYWGCDGGPRDTVETLTQQRTYGSQVQACFDNSTLGDELDTAGVSWKYYTAGINGDGELWNAYQAIKHIRYGADWKTHVVDPQTKFFTGCTYRKIARGELGNADLRELRSCQLHHRPRTVVGCIARKCGREVAVLGFDRHFRDVGRFRRLVRSRRARNGRLRRARHPSTPTDNLAVRQEELRDTRALRTRKPLEIRRRPVRAREAGCQRCARGLSGKGLLRFLAASAFVRDDSEQARTGRLRARAARSAPTRR